MIYYFAYGSNLHPVRLMERVPSAKFICVTEIKKHALTFHKKGKDGSTKCDLFQTGEEADVVYGAIYTLDASDKAALDGFEGKGAGYMDTQILLRFTDKEYNCFTYIAQQSHIVENLQPYHWYKKLVVLGAEYLKFPDAYISAIESVESKEDPDEIRKEEKGILIESIINYR